MIVVQYRWQYCAVKMIMLCSKGDHAVLQWWHCCAVTIVVCSNGYNTVQLCNAASAVTVTILCSNSYNTVQCYTSSAVTLSFYVVTVTIPRVVQHWWQYTFCVGLFIPQLPLTLSNLVSDKVESSLRWVEVRRWETKAGGKCGPRPQPPPQPLRGGNAEPRAGLPRRTYAR